MVAARLNGRVDFLRLETYNQGRQIDWGFMSAYRRSELPFYTSCQIAAHFIFIFFWFQLMYAQAQREAYRIHCQNRVAHWLLIWQHRKRLAAKRSYVAF